MSVLDPFELVVRRMVRSRTLCSTLHNASSTFATANSTGKLALSTSSSSSVQLYTHVYNPTTVSTANPVVFVHGLLGSGTNFRTYQLKVAQHRRTLAVDLRNHGKSPHLPGPMTLQLLANDVAETIRQHYGSERVDLVGHSLGGKTGMVLANDHPAVLSSLVVVDISPVAYDTSDAQWRNVAGIVQAAHKLRPEDYKTRGEIDAVLAKSVQDPGVRSFVAQNLVPQPDGSYRWRINTGAILESMSNFATFPAIQGPLSVHPVHFIAGSRSSYIQRQFLPSIHKLFPSAHVHHVDGAGHWVHADKPTEFWQLLAKLLALPA